ncbi:MAG: ATP-binding protein [Candidatus Methanomethyliaceae archaeon]|nr:ATP-binding protein [Candidatus Methanomethyliaceae archaeon]MDW7971483.1 ATP-binding protein [Nitrososphaerota archaeon]
MLSSIKAKLLISFTLMLTLFIIINFTISQSSIYFIIIPIMAIVLSTAYTLYINRVALSPIEKMKEFLTEIIIEGELSKRLKISGGREIEVLANTINMLLSELEKLLQKERKIYEKKMEVFKLDFDRKLEDVFNITESIALIWDINGKIKRINKYGLEFLKISESELLGKDVEEVFRISIHDLFQRNCNSHINEIERKDGSKAWIHWIHKIMKEEDGIVVLSIGEDITEKINIKEMELKKAKITNKFYEKLISMGISLNEILDAVIEEAVQLTGSKCGFLWMTNENEGWMNIIENGKRRRLMIKRDVHEILKLKSPIIVNSSDLIFPGMDLKINRYLAVPCSLENTIGGILVANKECNYNEGDFEILNYISKYFVLALQRHKLEEKIRVEFEEMMAIFDSIEDPIYVIDLNTHEIIYANKYLCKILNDNPIGKICYKEIKGLDKPCSFCTNEILLKQNIYRYENYNEKLKKYYNVIIKPIRWPDGRIVKFEYAIDISDRKYLEEELKNKILDLEKYSKNLEKIIEEKSKALLEKERLATIGEMALMIGHDLRNPLQAIVYSLYLMRRNFDNKLSIQEHIDRIYSSLEYMNKIVSDLQDFARPIKMSSKNVNLRKIFENVLSSIRIPENVNVVLDVDSMSEGEMDERLISRALMNLIINAIQAMPNGGTLKLSAKIEENSIKIIVEDTGIGMSEEVLKNIFKPFYTTKPKGMGLGLCIVKRLIEEHKGKIEVKSELGKGTKFIIEIPKVNNIQG